MDMSTQGAKSTVDIGAALDVVPTPEKEYTTSSTGKLRKFMNHESISGLEWQLCCFSLLIV